MGDVAKNRRPPSIDAKTPGARRGAAKAVSRRLTQRHQARLENLRAPGASTSILADDAADRGDATETAKSAAGTTRYVRFGTSQTRGMVLNDPALMFSWYVRARLGLDRARQPSPCRVLDPKTGEIVQVLDPLTRHALPRAAWPKTDGPT